MGMYDDVSIVFAIVQKARIFHQAVGSLFDY